MNLLFLTPDLPYPPQQGAAIRSYQFISRLSSKHEIHLLSFAEKEPEPDSLAHLQNYCRRVEVVPAPPRSNWDRLRTLFFSQEPDMATRRASPHFKSRLESFLMSEKFDIVQVESLEMAPYITTVRRKRAEGLPRIIFDDLNVEYLLQRRAWETDLALPPRWGEAFYSLIQWQRLILYERAMLQLSDGVLAVSQRDAEHLQQLSSSSQIGVVGNGVDTSFYLPGEQGEEKGLVFVGKMDFRPNIDAVLWFTEKVWPRIKQRKPKTQFWVVGRNLSPRLQHLKRDPQIIITGPIPDVRPYLAQAAVVVIPLRMGSGTRLKILEAMAMGKAIVSTSLGGEGIALQSGQEVLIADTPHEFAHKTLQLLESREERKKLGTAARRLVEEKYDWQAVIPRLEEFYAQILPPEPRRR